jgi:capsular exopolysaccharide synthesis family protein
VNVTAAVEPETNILKVTTTADTPVKAHQIMNSVLENYGEVSSYLFGGVVLDAIRSPHVPTSPSNPFPMTMYVALGAFAAMCAMLAAIVYLSLQRGTVKTLDGAKAYMHESPVAVLIREKPRRVGGQRQKGLLITRTTISFRYTEAVLQLAHRIRHKMRKQAHKVLLITSVAENEGKSTVAANLAVALAKHGSRVALVDMDMRRPAIHKLFSEIGQGYDLQDCIYNGLPQELDSRALLLFTQAKPQGNVSQLLHDPAVGQLLEQLRQQMYYVILDTPPYMAVADTGMLLKFADASLMVLRQDWVPGQTLDAVTQELTEQKAEYLGYVLNYYIDDGSLKTKRSYYDKYSRYGGYSREEQL